MSITLLYNTLYLYCICILDVLEYSSNDIGETLSLERKAFVSLPDTNYSTFLQMVDPFIPATPRGISHDHEQVRFNAVSKHWFPAADSTSCNGVRIFHVRRTILNGGKKWQSSTAAALTLLNRLSGNIKKPYRRTTLFFSPFPPCFIMALWNLFFFFFFFLLRVIENNYQYNLMQLLSFWLWN